MKIGFDNELYIEKQSEKINERIASFDNKLYLEFGGKLFDDYHASRVLPGFAPDSKIKMLLELKDKTEVIIAIAASDIIKNKFRSDIGVSYNDDVLRLIDAFKEVEMKVCGVCITQYQENEVITKFKKKLENLGIKVALNYMIQSYPNDISKIVSERGFGKNEYLTTTSELIVVTAPGPGSGKMATCLNQMYHDNINGVKSGYAKFETFPVHNIPINNLVNVAYEAATIDLEDMNMIDPFHLQAYGSSSVNYNRDIETFPVLNRLLTNILGVCPYKSPTDMGVNMVGYCITDNTVCEEAAYLEIIRRYYQTRVLEVKSVYTKRSTEKIETLCANNNIDIKTRDANRIANDLSKKYNGIPVVAITINKDKTITGKGKTFIGAGSACILNTLKYLANIPDEVDVISPSVIKPIQRLKVAYLGDVNPLLHIDETLIALAISASTSEFSYKAYKALGELRNLEAHSTVILSEDDYNNLKHLGIHITTNPKYSTKKLYQK